MTIYELIKHLQIKTSIVFNLRFPNKQLITGKSRHLQKLLKYLNGMATLTFKTGTASFAC